MFNFRNLDNQEIHFSPGANFILGRNGQGKTNLVEAINFLSLTRSFRTSSLSELMKFGHSEASVFAEIHQEISKVSIGLSIEHKTKTPYVNGQVVRSISEFVGRLLCVSFSPTDLTLIKGSPQERRRFVDKHMVDAAPKIMPHLLQCNRALKNKNMLLKQGFADPAALSTWNEILARESRPVLESRRKFLIDIEPRANALYQRFSQSDGELGLEYYSNLHRGHDLLRVGTLPNEPEILRAIEEEREKDIQYQSARLGTHKDEIVITIGENDSRAFASQGQSRSAVLALKLAVIEYLEEQRGDAPVVLLDDVDSELDSLRREALAEMVLAQKRQIFVTGTELRSFTTDAQARMFHIESGKVVGG